MRMLRVSMVAALLVLSACGPNRSGGSEKAVELDRIVDLGGRGVVTYRVNRPDQEGGGYEDGKISDVKAIRFYESYIVVEFKDAAKVFSSESLIIFEWKK